MRMTFTYALLLLALLPGARTARAEAVAIPGPEGVTLRAELFLPEGGPRGAPVVALHGCGGAYPSRDRQWTEALLAAGHEVLFPDSFGSRGAGSQCRVKDAERVATAGGLRKQDALAAARWLAARPGTPSGAVVILGWSDGGSTVMATAGDPAAKGLVRGFVAFYPGCRGVAPDFAPVAPLLMLMGAADDWTPIAPCRALADRTPGMTLDAFEGAYHDFDAPRPVRVQTGIPHSQNADHTVHTGGDPEARAAALARVPAWIGALPPVR